MDENLENRLSRALLDLEERDRRIRVLEQQLRTMNGIAPADAIPEPRELATAATFEPNANNGAPRGNAPDAEAAPTATASGTIEWHAVTIDSRMAELQSSAPASQRRTERHAAELVVEFDLDTQFYTGITQDISEGGIFIATYRVHPVGTSIGLAFGLPDGTKIETQGEVRWVRDVSNGCRPGMGVAFVDLDSGALAAITRFCRDHTPLYVEV